jgi:hypothetical protein
MYYKHDLEPVNHKNNVMHAWYTSCRMITNQDVNVSSLCIEIYSLVRCDYKVLRVSTGLIHSMFFLVDQSCTKAYLTWIGPVAKA